MPHQIKPLPFSSKLAGISEKTIQTHHDKLYAGYVTKKNEIEEKLKTADKTTANATYSDFRELKLEESFATNGAYLHEFYFDILGGNGDSDDGKELQKTIETDFESFDKWIEDFKACGLASRGWVVLGYDRSDQKLHNYLCDLHNHGGIWGVSPIIVLDIYEHAYFIDYASDKKAYIEDFFKNLNWQKANKIFLEIKK